MRKIKPQQMEKLFGWGINGKRIECITLSNTKRVLCQARLSIRNVEVTFNPWMNDIVSPQKTHVNIDFPHLYFVCAETMIVCTTNFIYVGCCCNLSYEQNYDYTVEGIFSLKYIFYIMHSNNFWGDRYINKMQ